MSGRCEAESYQLPATSHEIAVSYQSSAVSEIDRRSRMQDFRNLAVWRKSHSLTLEVYRLTECFPRAELFGLTSQVRRSCASISANLAEGCARTQPEFARFVQIALGSASETDYHLLLARDLGFVNATCYEQLSIKVVELKRMLTALQQRIQARAVPTRPQSSRDRSS